MHFSRVQAHGDWGSAVLKRIRDQFVGDDPELLGRGSVKGLGVDLDRNRHWSPDRDAVEQRTCIDGLVGLCQQPMDGRDRVDAGGGIVEGTTVTALRTAEQEEVGGGLEVVLDPVIGLRRQYALELGTGGGARVRGRFASDRSREDEYGCYRGCEQREPHCGCSGRERDERGRERAGSGADGEPEPAAPADLDDRDERDREEEEEREVRAAGEYEHRDESDQSSGPEVEE
jgi:hypothetical protein